MRIPFTNRINRATDLVGTRVLIRIHKERVKKRNATKITRRYYFICVKSARVSRCCRCFSRCLKLLCVVHVCACVHARSGSRNEVIHLFRVYETQKHFQKRQLRARQSFRRLLRIPGIESNCSKDRHCMCIYIYRTEFNKTRNARDTAAGFCRHVVAFQTFRITY